MSHPLDALFRPRSVAIIGASSDANRIGGRPVRFSKYAFKGAILPINPNQTEIQGLPAFASVRDVPGRVDQAIVAVPAKAAVQAVDDCIAKGVKAIVMFSSGFAETGAEGRAMQAGLARRCAAGGVKLLGPNSLGMLNVEAGLYSTFSSYFDPLWPRSGPVGIVSQSGAFGTYFLALAVERGLGFSHFVATGNEADIDVAACVDWLADDPATGVIMIYLEGCRDGARLRAALAKAAANRKPVIAMKVGVSDKGIAAIASHTGTLAGSDAVFDAVFRENNVHRARTLDELVDVAYACSGGVFPGSPRVGVVTISGGVGIQMADAAADLGLELPRMPEAAQRQVLAMVPFAGPANPVDATAQVINDWSMFTKILRLVAEEGNVDSVISFLAHTGTTPGVMERLKPALQEVRTRFPERVFILCMRMPREMADEFTRIGFLVFEDPTRAIAAVAALSRLAQGYARPRIARAEIKAAPALPGPINEAEAKRILSEAGVPFAPERVARTRDEAVAAAKDIGFPVVLKILSADIAHKSEAGGVALGLRHAQEVAQAYDTMIATVAQREPSARIDGVLVARMIEGVETVIGVKRDAVFGPVVMFGLGGIYVEVLKDVTLRLAPVDRSGALEMIRAINGFPLLAGARGRPAVELDALADALVAMSRFGAAHPEVGSAEINPFIALPAGGVAVDALILTGEGE
ncbi:MAG: acetate--CoA ligase family protein [Alphaproteobacteria bacterium]|nr:MAG: acetate--CoA ligase family protein [Alphaproteobacteria bacterium]